MSCRHVVSRNEDMSPNGKLVLYEQDDGDIIVAVHPDPDHGSGNSVEFCMPMTGGGRSPRTLRALRNLVNAMILDNKERLIGTSENIVVDFKPPATPGGRG